MCPPRPTPASRVWTASPPNHQPVSDAGSDRDDGEPGPPAPRTEPALGFDKGDHVVLDGDRDAAGGLQRGPEVHVRPIQERRTDDAAGIVDSAAEADADADQRGGRERREVRDHLGEDGDDVFRGDSIEGDLTFCERPRSGIGQHRVQSVAGDFDARERAQIGSDVERAHGAPDRAGGLLAELDEQSPLEEGLGEPRQTRGGEAQSPAERTATDRAVNENLTRQRLMALRQHDTPRLLPSWHQLPAIPGQIGEKVDT